MKKIFMLVLAVMLLCTSAVALAAAKPYKNPNYNFQNVKNIHLTVIDNRAGSPVSNFVADQDPEDKVVAAIYEAAGKVNINVLEEPNAVYNTDPNAVADKNPKDLELRITVNHCGYTTVYVPGYYEDYKEAVTRYYYDENGVRQSYTDYVPKRRWVSEKYYNNAYLSLIYKFYDMQTGAMVASLSDSRDRDYEDNPTGGMLSRSTRDCFKSIFKK